MIREAECYYIQMDAVPCRKINRLKTLINVKERIDLGVEILV